MKQELEVTITYYRDVNRDITSPRNFDFLDTYHKHENLIPRDPRK